MVTSDVQGRTSKRQDIAGHMLRDK